MIFRPGRLAMLFPLALFLMVDLPAGPGAVPADGPPDNRMLMLARSHYEKGMKLLEAGKEKEGEAEILEAVRVFPDFADAHLQLGQLAMRRKDFRRGLECFLQAKSALVHLQALSRQQEAERRRRLQEGLDILQERIEQLQNRQGPGDESRIAETRARMEKLRQEQTKLFPVEGPPIPPEIHFLIGNARMNLEQFDQALEDYREALVLRPDYGEVHNNLAVIYFYRKDYPRAWEHLLAAEKAGVRINPRFREELSAASPEPAPAP